MLYHFSFSDKYPCLWKKKNKERKKALFREDEKGMWLHGMPDSHIVFCVLSVLLWFQNFPLKQHRINLAGEILPRKEEELKLNLNIKDFVWKCSIVYFIYLKKKKLHLEPSFESQFMGQDSLDSVIL